MNFANPKSSSFTPDFKDVVRLEIAVDDAQATRGIEGIRDLHSMDVFETVVPAKVVDVQICG